MRKRAITLSEIAQLSGVSQPIVSKVLHGGASNARVSKETAERVRKVAEEAGYRPNLAARAVRTGRFGALGLLLSTSHHRSILPGSLLDALLQKAAKHDLHLTVAQLPDEQIKEKGITPRIFTEWLVDGLLINYNAEIPQSLLELLSRGDIPSIWLNTKQPLDCVHPDDFQGASLITQHLIELGHRSIAYAIYAGWGHYSTHERCAGYCAAMGTAGLPPEILTLYANDREHLDYSIKRLERAEGRPTAIICYADKTLRPILKAAARLGLQVPDDLSIAVFANEPARDVELEICSVVVPSKEMAHHAVDMLIQRIEDPASHSPPRAIPFQLFLGNSTAPPPSP